MQKCILQIEICANGNWFKEAKRLRGKETKSDAIDNPFPLIGREGLSEKEISVKKITSWLKINL